jgi:hypothetical protein
MAADDANNTDRATLERLEGPQLRALIEARCAQQQRGAVLAARGHLVTEAVLLRLEGQILELELFGPAARQLRSQPAVTVCFADGTIAHTFFARVDGYLRATLDSPAKLRLVLPAQISALSIPAARVTRHSFRVPVVGDVPMSVDARDDDGQAYQARVLDISLGGMLLELRRNVPPSLAPGHGLEISFAYAGATLQLRAEVRSCEGAEIGICFYTFGEGDDLRPPPRYERLVSQLERQWLRDKRGS